MEKHDNSHNQRQVKEPKLDYSLLTPYELQSIGFKEQIELIKERTQNVKNSKSLFKIQTANEWIEQSKNIPIPFMLFSEFWHENELCILFADTNVGKSILAVQIGESISRGESIKGFKLESSKQPVLYFDFELSPKQFEARFSVKNEAEMLFENHYVFDDSLKRVVIDSDAEIPEDVNFDEYLNQCLEQSIIETKSKILIIDNITYLKGETEKAKEALPLMKHLKALKEKYKLSILVLAHTPKRDSSKILCLNDLAGSKMLSNFIDSCFAIGVSHKDSGMRYIKQLKARNTEIVFDTDNVALCQLQKPNNFLKFCYLGTCAEYELLRKDTDEDREVRINKVKELNAKGMSQRAVAKELSISLGAVNKYLNS